MWSFKVVKVIIIFLFQHTLLGGVCSGCERTPRINHIPRMFVLSCYGSSLRTLWAVLNTNALCIVIKLCLPGNSLMALRCGRSYHCGHDWCFHIPHSLNFYLDVFIFEIFSASLDVKFWSNGIATTVSCHFVSFSFFRMMPSLLISLSILEYSMSKFKLGWWRHDPGCSGNASLQRRNKDLGI